MKSDLATSDLGQSSDSDETMWKYSMDFITRVINWRPSVFERPIFMPIYCLICSVWVKLVSYELLLQRFQHCELYCLCPLKTSAFYASDILLTANISLFYDIYSSSDCSWPDSPCFSLDYWPEQTHVSHWDPLEPLRAEGHLNIRPGKSIKS